MLRARQLSLCRGIFIAADNEDAARAIGEEWLVI